jgi:hypothetical protein
VVHGQRRIQTRRTSHPQRVRGAPGQAKSPRGIAITPTGGGAPRGNRANCAYVTSLPLLNRIPRAIQGRSTGDCMCFRHGTLSLNWSTAFRVAGCS